MLRLTQAALHECLLSPDRRWTGPSPDPLRPNRKCAASEHQDLAGTGSGLQQHWVQQSRTVCKWSVGGLHQEGKCRFLEPTPSPSWKDPKSQTLTVSPCQSVHETQ